MCGLWDCLIVSTPVSMATMSVYYLFPCALCVDNQICMMHACMFSYTHSSHTHTHTRTDTRTHTHAHTHTHTRTHTCPYTWIRTLGCSVWHELVIPASASTRRLPLALLSTPYMSKQRLQSLCRHAVHSIYNGHCANALQHWNCSILCYEEWLVRI